MTPKASMASLPTEIKTRIAELCRLQDEIFQDIEEETDVFKKGPFSDYRFILSGYPKSLLSLWRVSKEWHDIAVKIVFRKVDARSCSKPIFLYALAPRYGHLVEELDISRWSETCSAINTLTSLALLSNVRNIALPSAAHVCERLANETRGSDFPVEFASPGSVAIALRRVMKHAETVVLPRDGFLNAIPLVRGAGMTKLEMVLSSGDLPILLSTIIDCPNLRTLHITGGYDDRHTFKDAASLPSLSHPTLRRLEIFDQSGGKGLYDFIQLFSSTLEELNIYWGVARREEVTPPEPPRFRLPRLQHLEVRGALRETAPLVHAISPAAFPALQSCTWLLYRDLLPRTGKAFPAQVVAAIRRVRAQQIPRAAPLKFTVDWAASPEAEEVATLQTALEEAGIPIGVGQGGAVVEFAKPDSEFDYGPPDPPALILTPKLCRTNDSKVADLGEDISASLDRIRDLKDQAVAVGDRVQISRIAEALQEGEWLCVERQC